MPALKTPTQFAQQPLSQQTSISTRIREVGITGLLVAVVLSVLGILLVFSPDNNGSLPAAVGILFMTVPVILARRQPLYAVGIVAGAAIVNGLLSGDVIRCGAAFPALLYITFAVGARSRLDGGSWRAPVIGLALAMVSVAAQQAWDPALDGGFLVLAIPLVLLTWGAGLAWAARSSRISNGRRRLRSS